MADKRPISFGLSDGAFASSPSPAQSEKIFRAGEHLIQIRLAP